jgi:hypothetical protein
VKWCGKRSGVQCGLAAGQNISKVDVEGRLKLCEMSTAEQVEVPKGLVIASHEKMLTVIDDVAGRVVAE